VAVAGHRPARIRPPEEYASLRTGRRGASEERSLMPATTPAQTITPYLLYEDAEAAAGWLTEAFGAREVDRMDGAAGGLHVELELEDGGRVYVGTPPGDFHGPRRVGRTSLLYVLVDDVDAHFERAQEADAEVIEEPADQPYGHRRYSCRDPEGHEWTFACPLDGAGATG